MPDHPIQSVSIERMHCEACVRRVTAALAGVPNIRVHRVEVGRAEIVAEPSARSSIQAAVEQAGFTVRESHASS